MTNPLTTMGAKAAIGVSQPKWTDAEMQEIDTAIDDGNLNTGNFRKFVIKFMLVIE